MSSTILDIRQYTFREGDRLLLDANVWLTVYGPSPPLSRGKERTRVYSAALRNMIAAQSEIILDVLVLSEFINRFARLEYNQLPAGKKPREFKQYRDSAAFKTVAADIVATARRILRFTSRYDSGFDSVDIEAMLTLYASGKSDFNDLMLAELCKAQSLVLVTHDADFRGSAIPILTANRGLIGS